MDKTIIHNDGGNMKTIKQIANELGIDKQKVYRFVRKNHIKNHINEAHKNENVMYYNDAAETLIKSHFSHKSISKTTSSETHQKHINEAAFDVVSSEVISLLKQELEVKNTLITKLQKELAEEREHNRNKDKRLLDTLDKIANSQVALATSQTLDKALELKGTQSSDEDCISSPEKRNIFKRIFGK